MLKSKVVISLLPLIILILLFFVGFLAISKMQKEQDLSTKLDNMEEVYLPNFSFSNLYDPEDFLTNKDLIKSSYSLLNIFASWCSGCVVEHDELLRLSKFIDIYAIAYQDIDKNTKKYLDKYQNPYKKIGIDRRGELSKILMVKAIPETFLIDKNGKIIHRYQGVLNKEMINFYKKILLDK